MQVNVILLIHKHKYISATSLFVKRRHNIKEQKIRNHYNILASSEALVKIMRSIINLTL